MAWHVTAEDALKEVGIVLRLGSKLWALTPKPTQVPLDVDLARVIST